MRTLVSYLNEKSPQELMSIAQLWEANLTGKLYPGSTYQLAQEMQSEFLQRRLIEKLSPAQLSLLNFLISQPAGGASLEEGPEGLNGAELKAQFQRLRQF